MKNRIFIAVLALHSFRSGAEPIQDIDKAGPVAQEAADSTAMMADSPKIAKKSSGDGYDLNWNAQNYCPGHPFRGQKKLAGGFCTSFLIASNMVATAGHCLRGKNCKTGITFIFGLKNSSPTAPGDDVYKCSSVRNAKIPDLETPGKKYSYNDDIAIITLDRPVKGRKPLQMDFSKYDPKRSSSDMETMLTTSVGYADGLPVKASNGYRVTAPNGESNGVSTSAQIVGGMSGGPVVSVTTGKVIGVSLTGSPTMTNAKTGCRYIGDPYPNKPDEARDENNYFNGYGYASTQSLQKEIPAYSTSPGRIEFINAPSSMTGAPARR
ncbi:MAG: trypsin-like serine peptidase [Bdellovibrionales bacterium]